MADAAPAEKDRSRSPRDAAATPAPAPPADFFSREFLVAHMGDILRFYDGRAVDSSGGFHQSFYDDGTVFNTEFKQLVSSSRMVINYALAGVTLGRPELVAVARHGLEYVEKSHWLPETQTYAFTLRNHEPEDLTQQSYAYAFVLAMHAAALKAGIHKDGAELERVFNLMESRFWLEDKKAYSDTITPDGVLSSYRGQNSNMHICEAMISAYEATKDQKYLDRAITLAETFTQRQAGLADGLIWEHYTETFEIDWEYNKDDPKNLYRPWGFQPGHQNEWAKNLLNIHRQQPHEWMVKRAKELFDRAWENSWDAEHGGLVYGFGPDGKWCDDDKYFWVQAESFATAALLFQATGEEKYREQYVDLWKYSWAHFVDHQYGAWYRVLHRNGAKYSNEKSAAGSKCDYHTLVSCIEALRVFP